MTILLFYSSRAKSRTFECVKITVATHMTETGVVMEAVRRGEDAVEEETGEAEADAIAIISTGNFDWIELEKSID